MTYTQDDFERDYKCVELACEDSDWKYGPCGIPPTLASVALKRIIDAYRDLQAENDRLTVLKRIIAAYRDQWKARAEAAEKVCEAAKAHVAIRDCFTSPDPMDIEDCPYCRFDDVCSALRQDGDYW